MAAHVLLLPWESLMFQMLWYFTWFVLLLAVGRAAFAAHFVYQHIKEGVGLHEFSFWQLLLIPFTVFGMLMLVFEVRLRLKGRPGRSHWRRLTGLVVMIVWLLVLSSQA